MAVHFQVNALKQLGPIERQDSPPAIFGERAARWDLELGGVACPSTGSSLDKRKGRKAD